MHVPLLAITAYGVGAIAGFLAPLAQWIKKERISISGWIAGIALLYGIASLLWMNYMWEGRRSSLLLSAMDSAEYLLFLGFAFTTALFQPRSKRFVQVARVALPLLLYLALLCVLTQATAISFQGTSNPATTQVWGMVRLCTPILFCLLPGSRGIRWKTKGIRHLLTAAGIAYAFLYILCSSSLVKPALEAAHASVLVYFKTMILRDSLWSIIAQGALILCGLQIKMEILEAMKKQ